MRIRRLPRVWVGIGCGWLGVRFSQGSKSRDMAGFWVKVGELGIWGLHAKRHLASAGRLWWLWAMSLLGYSIGRLW